MRPQRRTGLGFANGLMALLVVVLGVAQDQCRAGPTIAPAFAGSYSLTDLGNPTGVPGNLGGVAFLAGDPNTLLIGGNANSGSGQISSIGVIRGAGNHITGFSGSAAFFSTAPAIDGGLQYGPGGVLFFTSYPTNQVGEIKPGSTAPDKTVDLTPLGVTSSVGSLGFVPGGFPGSGAFKLASINFSRFYDAKLMADGTGTFDIPSATLTAQFGAIGPEGFGYVPLGSPLFPSPSLLLTEFFGSTVGAYQLDASGNPIPATGQLFIQGLDNPEGMAVDPLTGDILISTFSGETPNHVFVVEGFGPAVPEPGSLSLFAIGILGLLGYGRWRRQQIC